MRTVESDATILLISEPTGFQCIVVCCCTVHSIINLWEPPTGNRLPCCKTPRRLDINVASYHLEIPEPRSGENS